MDEIRFKKIANEIEAEFQMGGLSDGLYYDFALECARRYYENEQADSADFDIGCKKCGGEIFKFVGVCPDCGEHSR